MKLVIRNDIRHINPNKQLCLSSSFIYVPSAFLHSYCIKHRRKWYKLIGYDSIASLKEHILFGTHCIVYVSGDVIVPINNVYDNILILRKSIEQGYYHYN